jgi:threonylcarbamoyladenosine tRNA methylthiotransferase MtaB
VNQYDSGRLEKLLSTSGFLAVSQNASLVVVNTCSVTKTAVVKDQRLVRYARKENPSAKIVVMGCWPRIYKVDEAVDLVVKDKDVKVVMAEINKLFFGNKKDEREIGCGQKIVSSNLDRSRYFITIQDGC